MGRCGEVWFTQTEVEDLDARGLHLAGFRSGGQGCGHVRISHSAIARTGLANVETLLQRLPASAGNAGGQTNAYWTGNGYGTAQVNLRGLGINRTLVLLNGRRVVYGGTGANSAVDLNTIPAALISRIDVLKDGASAIYGADAVAGVVNFITLGHFEGIRTDLQYGNSERGDYEQISSSAAFGTSFADGRGNALLSIGYSTRQGLNGSKRDFFDFVTPSSFIGQGTFVPSAQVTLTRPLLVRTSSDFKFPPAGVGHRGLDFHQLPGNHPDAGDHRSWLERTAENHAGRHSHRTVPPRCGHPS